MLRNFIDPVFFFFTQGHQGSVLINGVSQDSGWLCSDCKPQLQERGHGKGQYQKFTGPHCSNLAGCKKQPLLQDTRRHYGICSFKLSYFISRIFTGVKYSEMYKFSKMLQKPNNKSTASLTN